MEVVFSDTYVNNKFTTCHCLQRGCFCPEALYAASYVLRMLLHYTHHAYSVDNAKNTRNTRRTRKTHSTGCHRHTFRYAQNR